MLDFCKTFPAEILKRVYLLETQAHPLYVNLFDLAQVLQNKDWSQASWQIPNLLNRMLVKRYIEAGRGKKVTGFDKVRNLGRVLCD